MPRHGGVETELGGGVVLYEKMRGRSEGVCVITLNKPQRMNGWGEDLGTAWYDAYDLATADPDVRVIIVTGAGRAWCAGADMKVLPPSLPPLCLPTTKQIYNRFSRTSARTASRQCAQRRVKRRRLSLKLAK